VSNRPNRQPSSSQRVRDAANGGRSSLVWVWIGIAVVVVLAVIVAVVISASGGDDSADGGGASPSGGTVVPSGDSEFGGAVTVTGADLSSDRASVGTTADPAIGQTLPTITGTQVDGSPITIEPGRPMVIIGVAHWCPHCQAEVPRIQEWLDENGMPTDVELVTIATDNDLADGNGPAGKWLRSEGWSVPTLLDDEEKTAGTAIGLSGFPFFVVVDADGQVVLRGSGELTMSQFEQLLEAARTGEFPT
jgi:cytochrome c biogenesis protein CcmG/thiol:disulfide interchange protein DsbE